MTLQSAPHVTRSSCMSSPLPYIPSRMVWQIMVACDPEQRPPIEEVVRMLRRLRREAGVPPAHALKSRPCRVPASSVPSDTPWHTRAPSTSYEVWVPSAPYACMWLNVKLSPHPALSCVHPVTHPPPSPAVAFAPAGFAPLAATHLRQWGRSRQRVPHAPCTTGHPRAADHPRRLRHGGRGGLVSRGGHSRPLDRGGVLCPAG